MRGHDEMSMADPQALKVLIIEDDPDVRLGCEQALQLEGIPTLSADSAEAARPLIDADFRGVVVSDIRLPRVDGMRFMRELLAVDAELPVVLITGHGDVTMAVQAMRAHAYDFIEKPFNSARLVDVVRRALEKRALLIENRRLREQLGNLREMPLIGHSEGIEKVRRTIDSLAATDVDILILGETGTGKEVVAHALHAQSGRKGPFVALNCGALPESVFESEMFGHEKGAFTGAARRRIGKIEYASDGTLFLDEIESMPLSLQVKLLRVLQERCIERLGSNTAIPVNCRIVAASKTDLKRLSDQGGFRADLYYRLNVVTIALPPLRQRLNDLAPLITYFLSQAGRRFNRDTPEWTENDLFRWQHYDWPGNVRELKAVAERLCLGVDDGLEALASASVSLAARLENHERCLIREALRGTRGNVADAAERLQLPKKTLYDKLARHALDPESFRG